MAPTSVDLKREEKISFSGQIGDPRAISVSTASSSLAAIAESIMFRDDGIAVDWY